MRQGSNIRKKKKEQFPVDRLLNERISRRKALSTGAKVGLAAGVGIIIGAVGGYFGGISTVKPSVSTTTVTQYSTVTKTVTQSVSPTVTVTKPSKKYAGETIVFTYVDAGFTKAIPDVLPKFTEETGIKVVAERYSASALIAKELADFRAKTGSHDVVINHVSNGALLMGEGFLEPLDEYIERDKDELDFQDIPQSAILFRWPWPNGKIYSLPIHAGSPPTLGVNKKHLEEVGLPLKAPETYDDWMDYAAKLTKKPDRYGAVPFAGSGGELHTVAAFFQQTARGFGGDIIVPAGDGKWKVVVNSPEVKAALKYTKEMGDKYGPEGWTGLTLAEQMLLYTKGKVSTLMTFSDYWPQACQTPGLETLFGPVPAGKGGHQAIYINWEIGIPADSKHKEAAWELVKFLLRKDIHYYLVQKGCGAVRLSEFNNPELLKTRPFYKVMGETLAKGWTFGLPMIIPWGEITVKVVGPLVSGYYSGQYSVDDVVSKMESMIKDILKKNNLLAE
ncbi:MAG: extracellular solute-binding protein [Thaumarchaeota archaeon]|nr:extracellular solute-binding protein [Nitrososphaerota archaeon]